MLLGTKAAPPRTPEQLAELGKYSGRSSPSWVNIRVAASKLGKYSDPDVQVAVCPGKGALGANPEALGKMLTSIPPGAPGAYKAAARPALPPDHARILGQDAGHVTSTRAAALKQSAQGRGAVGTR